MIKKFEKFKDIPNDKLYKSTLFLDYVTMVMESMDTIVTELDDADKTHQNIKKIGSDHKKRNLESPVFNVSLLIL